MDPSRRPETPLEVLRSDWRLRGVGFDRPVLADRLFYLAAGLALALGLTVFASSGSVLRGVVIVPLALPWLGVALGSVREFRRGLRGQD